MKTKVSHVTHEALSQYVKQVSVSRNIKIIDNKDNVLTSRTLDNSSKKEKSHSSNSHDSNMHHLNLQQNNESDRRPASATRITRNSHNINDSHHQQQQIRHPEVDTFTTSHNSIDHTESNSIQRSNIANHPHRNMTKTRSQELSYYESFLLSKRRYVGSEPWITSCCSCCGSSSGVFEDFVRLLCNEHLFFAMFLADPAHPYSSWKRKISYFVNTSFTLLIITSVSYSNINSYISQNTPGFDHQSFIVTALILGPIVLILDEIFYYFIVCPCCVNLGKTCNYTSDCISMFLQVLAFLIGLASFLLSVLLASRLPQANLEWMINKIIMGLLVYPTIEKILLLVLPFIPLPLGCHRGKSYYISITG